MGWHSHPYKAARKQTLIRQEFPCRRDEAGCIAIVTHPARPSYDCGRDSNLPCLVPETSLSPPAAASPRKRRAAAHIPPPHNLREARHADAIPAEERSNRWDSDGDTKGGEPILRQRPASRCAMHASSAPRQAAARSQLQSAVSRPAGLPRSGRWTFSPSSSFVLLPPPLSQLGRQSADDYRHMLPRLTG